VFTVNLNWRITSFNKAAEKITGIPREEAVGRLCSEVLNADLCKEGCVLRQTMRSGEVRSQYARSYHPGRQESASPSTFPAMFSRTPGEK
jgi:PAS domain S-box-containing protein